MNPIRVMVADDHPAVRAGLADLIEASPQLQLVGVAADTDEAIALALRDRPDVALLDVSMPGGGGVRAAREIRRASPFTVVVAISAEHDRASVLAMLAAGALGYIVKGAAPTDIAETLVRAARGEQVIAVEAARGVADPEVVARGEETSSEVRRVLADRVRQIIQGETLSVVFQPIVDLRSRTHDGVEALARFPEGSPGAWFDAAEAVGLRTELELAAVRAALRGARNLPSDRYLTMNLSPDTIADPHLLPLLRGDESRNLVIDLTERARVSDYSSLTRTLAAYRANRSHRVAVDDAGCGEASLQNILEITPDFIKIDVSVIHDVERDRNHRAIASALITLGRELGAQVVAEGVETPEEAEALVAMGVTHGQGYLLGRPGPLDA